VHEVAFQLAPRLNAAGRLETAQGALQLLLCREGKEAETIACDLDEQNRRRQQIEGRIADEVLGALRSRFNPETDFVIVEGQLLWHIGVIGIVASRVLREFHRPTVIMGGEGEEWRGSGRSIDGFDLAAALRGCDDLLVRHGGHAMAAGLTIHSSKVGEFRSRLNELARRTLTAERLCPELRLDGEVGLSEMTLENLAVLEKLQPFGQGNPAVQLLFSGLRHHRVPQRVGKQGQHLKMWVTDGATIREAIWWNGSGKESASGRFDLAAVPQVNEFNGQTTVQLRVLGVRPV
jgi:single-stranded-DNA-specific exonuclease